MRVSSAMLGSELGLVNEFNLEPALASGDIVSNAADPGAPVYAVSGMKGAMIAANIGGSLRVFQRVSYSGTATIGGETRIIRKGDTYYTLPDVVHGVTCLKAGRLLDIFTPMRKDFLE